MSKQNQVYYAGRAVEERQREAHAKDPVVAGVHASFAARYESLAAQCMPKDKLELMQEGPRSADPR